jgi:hypothetical protein
VFLSTLREVGVTNYQRFTALVNAYYADPERTLDRLGVGSPADPDGDRAVENVEADDD